MLTGQFLLKVTGQPVLAVVVCCLVTIRETFNIPGTAGKPVTLLETASQPVTNQVTVGMLISIQVQPAGKLVTFSVHLVTSVAVHLVTVPITTPVHMITISGRWSCLIARAAAVLCEHVAALGVLAVAADPGGLQVVLEGVEGAAQHGGARVRAQRPDGLPERNNVKS